MSGVAGWGAATSGLPRLAADRSPVSVRSARYASSVLAQDWARYAASAPDGRASPAIRPHYNGPYHSRIQELLAVAAPFDRAG